MPERNPYFAPETDAHGGLPYQVSIDMRPLGVQPGLAYCERQDAAEMIAHALNAQVHASPAREFVLAKTPEAAMIYLAVRSYTYQDSIEDARRLLAQLRCVDSDFADAKIYQAVRGVQ